VLEEPLTGALGVLEESDDVVVLVLVLVLVLGEVDAASVFVLLSVELVDALSLEVSALFLAPLLLYRSAYQPPPLRMNPAPPETWRLAVAWWQCGHSVSADALMDCSASQAWPQAVQAYS
jgi:hypothetical protein